MKNVLGFEELFFMLGHVCVHYFFDGDEFWFKNSDLDSALEIQLCMNESNDFKPILVKGRKFTSLDECLSRVSNVSKIKSRTAKFILINVFQGLNEDPNTFSPDSVSISFKQIKQPVKQSRSYLMKTIRLDKLIGTGIDMQFGNDDQRRWSIEILKEIDQLGEVPYVAGNGEYFNKCKVRENHWHSICGIKKISFT